MRRILSAETTRAAEYLATVHGQPLAHVLAAAFAVLLRRYGAGPQVVFALTTEPDDSGSGARPAHWPIPSGATFHDVLRGVPAGDAATMDAGTPPTAFRSALHRSGSGRLAHARFSPSPGAGSDTPARSIDHDLLTTAARENGAVVLDWDYDPSTLEQWVVEQAATHYAQLLADATARPDIAVQHLELMTPTDLENLHSRWNTTRTPYPRCGVHRLIEDQARRTPEVTAVEDGLHLLSYAELDRDANRMARRLLDLGTRTGDMVGLCLDRSADLVVSVLAILKAGGTVVPLDAAYPPDRLRLMLEDAGVRIVVTSQALVDRTPPLTGLLDGLSTVCVDAERSALAGLDGHTLPEGPGPEDIAYCIYTSGSTGTPKGVLMEHSALVNLVEWHRSSWLVGTGLRTLLYSPISFDVAFHEIFAGLATGATLVQVDEETRRNPLALLDVVRERRIEKWYTPFVTLQQLAQAAQSGAAPTDLKELIVGGEVLRITPQIRDLARRTGCVIRNHYGSTECIDVATHTLAGDPDLWPDVAPIGRPTVHNMNLYILDEERRLLPPGVVGEIYAEGDCLARSYHHRPELTRERFLDSPFGVQGRRLYRMGDLGRYLPDGTVECLGRADDQVKVRGFRVEPGEVEAVLSRHRSVAECAVAARSTSGGTTRLVGYVVAAGGPDDRRRDQADLVRELRAHLSARLPEHMVPTAFVLLDALPLTPSGKVDVRALPEATPTLTHGPGAERRAPAPADVERIVSAVWGELLDLPEVDPQATFFELGGDSVQLVRAHQGIERALGRDLPVETLFRHPTVRDLAHALGTGTRPSDGNPPSAPHTGPGRPEPSGMRVPSRDPAPVPRQSQVVPDDVAIVGMALRVPGAQSPEEFWSNLRDGVESVRRLTEEELRDVDAALRGDPHFVPAAALLPGADLFDAELFGYSPAEAELIDPQQRIFLECAWEALEDAGVRGDAQRVGVYAGSGVSTYLINNILPARRMPGPYLSHRHVDEVTDLRIEQGNARDHLPTRVSFALGLQGPSINVQSTCSTSLVAVHLARQALLSGDCEVALAGGVSVMTPQSPGYVWRDGLMVSADGHCRAFDADADGTVFGHGLGVVVLKRLSAAIAAGDRVYAVVKGSAVNNDGNAKLDYSGPSVRAQADVIAQAHADAGLTADRISYVEAHGTGTRLGDPVEIAGLTEAFRRSSRRADRHCALGSVKTNVGHLDEAAGVIGLIKTALSLQHRQIPPTLNVRTPTPLARLEDTPFHLATALTPWGAEPGEPRRAGVSSFGMGGTNCHVVLEEAPEPQAVRGGALPQNQASGPGTWVLPLTARSPEALREVVRRHLHHLEERHPDEADPRAFADLCYSAATGRRHLGLRTAIRARDGAQARERLAAVLAELDRGSGATRVPDRPPRLAFLFTGQGSQRLGMGSRLYGTQPVYRAAVDLCDEMLRPLLGRSIADAMHDVRPGSDLHRAALAQPALFVLEYALTELWESWGIRPGLLVGHSLGELVAACVAGVLDLEDALRLVAARGRLMQELPATGGMAQVALGTQELTSLLAGHADDLAIAAVNSPCATVVSGRAEAVDTLCDELEGREVPVVRLPVSHAFHSPLMAPMLEGFRAVAESIRYSSPRIPVVSTVTGEPASEELCSAEHWVRQIVAPVLFDRAVRTAEGLGTDIFLEIGPAPTLTGLVRSARAERTVVPSVVPGDPEAVVAGLRSLYLRGAEVSWDGVHGPFGHRRVRLPSYAFQRRRHWIEPGPPSPEGPAPEALEVVWQPVQQSLAGAAVLDRTGKGRTDERYVVVGAADGLAGRLAAAIRVGSARVDVVEAGCADLSAMIAGIRALVSGPSGHGGSGSPDGPGQTHVVFAAEPSPTEDPDLSDADVPGAAAALLSCALEVAREAVRGQAASLWAVTREVGSTAGSSGSALAWAGLAPFVRTVAAEHPELPCTTVAVPGDATDADLRHAARLILRSSPAAAAGEQLAIRDGSAVRARIVPLSPSPVTPAAPPTGLPVRPDGTYLITGGTGGIGLRLALEVARGGPALVVLLSRRGEPDPGDHAIWDALTRTGTPVRVVRGDVADAELLREVLDDCGPSLRGVFHCAGVLEDGIVLRQAADGLDQVLRPKVAGAWALHRLTADRSLDFLVLFSSTASVTGYRGQGVYAAANGFLDALAAHRRRLGLPALSVSWGGWAGPGMTGRLPAPHRERLLEDGDGLLNPGAALSTLGSLMAYEIAHAIVRQPGIPGPGTHDEVAAASPPRRPIAPYDGLRGTVAGVLSQVLGRPMEEIDPRTGFQELGVDSLAALDLRGKLQAVLGLRLPATLAFEHPCLDELVDHLHGLVPASAAEAGGPPRHDTGPALRTDPTVDVVPGTDTRTDGDPAGRADGTYDAVAIIGMSCRLPGADSPEELWRLLIEGRDAVREIPPDRWRLDDLYNEDPDAPGRLYVRRAALIDDVAGFDARFFGISPREAASMDPRQRQLLQLAWSAVESAGLDPETLRGSDTAVYLGCDEFANDYLRLAGDRLGTEHHLAAGTTLSFSAGRISHTLGWHGPSLVVATACSSSLVALHTAVRALRQGECGRALVGGAKLLLDPQETVQLCRLRALAPDGVSKAFAADADGFGRGEGAVTLLLKRLDRALADGDPVLAVIRGTAVNHDGPSSGLTVPSGRAQNKLIAAALADARLDPADVTYVEAHGTGTQLGDPIELRALGQAFAGRRDPVVVGSIKANIGHLEEAAGLAGIVKTVLALRHGVIPPQIHCAELTPNVDWDDLPVTIPRTALPWPDDAPRIAGVSSFGMSGTNAHVLLEAAPAVDRESAVTAPQVFPFSAADDDALRLLLARMGEVVAESPNAQAVAHTLQAGRSHHRHRLAVVASDTVEVRDRLRAVLDGATDVPGVFRGRVATIGPRGTAARADLPARDVVSPQDLATPQDLAARWCAGSPVDWTALTPGGPPPRRVHLPGSPFASERIWIGEDVGRRTIMETRTNPATTTGPREATLARELRVQAAELLGLPAEDLPEDSSLDELGADSVTFMRLAQFVRQRYGVVVSFQQLVEEADTPSALSQLVSARLGTAGHPEPETIVAPERVTSRDGSALVPATSRSGPSHLEGTLAQNTESLTPRQERFLADLVAEYTARTPSSKAAAERDRPVMANCRMPPFRALLKELSYPLVAERSAGARFWDVDGNEYLDISMGYGVHLLGHQPDIVVEALRAQLDRGVHIGPQSDLAGETARLLCEITGMPRAVFCNSGTEAVMAALRFARAATGRTRFVMFEGSYHGWSDSTLALPSGAEGSVPMARGVGTGAMQDVVVLEYGAERSLETIRELGSQLAAVLVEPVQSRRPDLQPVGFLRELRELTSSSGTALILDEVITGFRAHPRGAQAWAGVDADLVVYGKVLGGGLPIGAVTGRPAFMDTVDGGPWRYGDDSAPSVATTFFGGTFNKNPLSMAAAHAVLTRLRAVGPSLQEDVARRVERFATDLNAFCRAEGYPVRVVHFSSLFRLIGEGDYSLQRFPLAIDLLFHLLTLRGVYVLETRVCFLSASHTDDDVRLLFDTVTSCLRDLREAGFMPAPPPVRGGVTGLPSGSTGGTEHPVSGEPGTERPGAARLLDDARLPVGFAPMRRDVGEPREVLLTGATGFLGAHLLAEILQATSARVHCPVRGADDGHAHARVLAALERAGHPIDEEARARVIALPADLTLPRLGLDTGTWSHLARDMDSIYHNGAHVSSLLPYDRLRAANVESTRELLGLAALGGASFHHVSSDAVFDAYGYHRQARIYEDEPLAHADTLHGGGYAETKWVADSLVDRARTAGLAASVYRPGMLTAALSGGAGQPGDFLTRFLKGAIQLGLCPELDGTIDLAPVDIVARTIVRLSRRDDSGRAYHLTHPDPIAYDALIDLLQDAGYRLDIVPVHVWDEALTRIAYEDHNALYPLLPLFTESSAPIFRRARLDTRNTRTGAGAVFSSIPDLHDLVPLTLKRLVEDGFLPPPRPRPPRGPVP